MVYVCKKCDRSCDGSFALINFDDLIGSSNNSGTYVIMKSQIGFPDL